MAKNYTVLTNLKVTGELLAKGFTVDGVDDITAPTAATSTTFDKDKFNAVVTAVNDIIELLGGTTT